MSSALWWVFAITSIVWGSGIFSARKRHIPWRKLWLFTIICWGGFLLLFVPSERLPRSLFQTRTGSLAILLTIIVLAGIGFLAKRKFVGYLFFAAGIVLLYSSFFAGLLFFYPLFALGFVSVAGSCYFAFVRKAAGSSG